MRHMIVLSVVLTWLIPGSSWAAASTLERGFTAGPYPGTADDAAMAFVATRPDLAASGSRQWRVVGSQDYRHHTAVRLQQLHHGVPVRGGEAMVKVEADGTVTWLAASTVDGLTVDVDDPIDVTAAAAAALATMERPPIADPRPVLEVLPNRDGGRLVYTVLLSSDAPVESWRVTVDARTGAVRSKTDLRRDALGWVYHNNPTDGATVEVELTDLTGDATITSGTYADVQSTVFDGGSQTTAYTAVADGDGNFFYEPEDPSVDDPFVEVHTYWHVTEVSRYFEDVHGHEFGGPALVTTNYRTSDDGTYDNAFYTPDMMGNTTLTLGQGVLWDYAYDSDVVVHEFGHSIIQDRTNMVMDYVTYDEYGWNNAPGGIHEGLADFWAATTQGDPVVGEYTIARTLDNDHTCPEDLTGEVHDDGEFVGATAWDIHEAVGKEAADAIVYGALGLVTSAPSFADLGAAMLELAQDLADDGTLTDDDVAAVEAIIVDRGMARCGRSLPMTIGEPFVYDVVHVMGLTDLPDSMCEMGREMDIVFATQYQFALTTPPAEEGPVEGIDLTFEMAPLAGGALGDGDLLYTFYVRRDEMVTFDFESVDLGFFVLQVPSGHEFDLEYPDEVTTISLTTEDIELANDTTYYLAMTHMNCPAVELTITPEVILGDPPVTDDDDDDDDASADDDTDGGGGCECTTDPALGNRPAALAPVTALATLATLALVLRLHRRRR